MPNLILAQNALKAVVIAGLLSVAVLTTPAGAAFLFFFKGPVSAPNERVCMNFAATIARSHNLQNVGRTQLEVSGGRGNAFAAITCIGNVTVVMVASDTDGEGRSLAQELFDGMKRERCIDEPC